MDIKDYLKMYLVLVLILIGLVKIAYDIQTTSQMLETKLERIIYLQEKETTIFEKER